MPKKYGYYVIKADIDEIWSKNAMFWENKKGKIIEQEISDNSFYRVYISKHSPSGKIYGFSGGETFNLKFGYLPEENTTMVVIEAKFSIFGKGAIWKIPNEIMKEWAKTMDIDHVKFQNQKTPKILEIAQRIDSILDNPEINVEKHYCPYCGAELKESQKICAYCDSDN